MKQLQDEINEQLQQYDLTSKTMSQSEREERFTEIQKMFATYFQKAHDLFGMRNTFFFSSNHDGTTPTTLRYTLKT